MPRRPDQSGGSPAEEELRQYRNVPVEVAARYLGMSSTTIKYALQEGRAPFGFASQNPEKGSYTYQISPERLIRYQSGELPMYRLNEVMGIMAAAVDDMLAAKMDKLNKALKAIAAV